MLIYHEEFLLLRAGLREELIFVKEDRLAGKSGFTIDKFDDLMTRTILEKTK